MKRFRLPSVSALLACCALAFASHAASVHASETGLPYGNRDLMDTDLSDAYRLPSIYVTDLRLTHVGSAVTGQFTVENKDEDLIAGLQYSIEVLGAADEALYARHAERAQFALQAGEKKDIPFAYDLPATVKGDARIRIQIVTSDGRYLGWRDEKIETRAAPLVLLTANGIQSSEYGQQTLEPLTGPNVAGNSAFSLSVLARNTGAKAVTLTPTIDTYGFDAARGEGRTQRARVVTLAAGEEREIRIPLLSAGAPGVYSSLLSLRDAKGNVASSLAEYRWVVRGVSADILPPRIRAFGTKAGEQAVIDIDVVGAPDAETRFEGYAAVELVDDDGRLAGVTSPAMLLTDGVASGTTRLTLRRDVSGTPMLRIHLHDAKGTLITSRTLSLPARTILGATLSSLDQKAMVLIAVGLIGLLLACGAILALRKQRIALLSSLQGLAMLVVFLAGSGTALGAVSNGIEVLTAVDIYAIHNVTSGRPVIMLFVNAPVHDAPAGTYAKNAVPLQYRVSYAVCANRWARARVVARFDKNGGKHSNLAGAPGSQWQTVHSQLYEHFGCPGGVLACVAPEGSFDGTMDFSALSPNVCSTTMQLWGELGQDGTLPFVSGAMGAPVPDGNVGPTDWWVQNGSATVQNFWVNFPCGPNLFLNKTGPQTAVRGGTISYTLTVTNNTNQNSTNVVITDPIPSGLTYNQGISSPQCSGTGATVTCSLGTLSAGQSQSVTVGFNIPSGNACTPTTITNSATVTSVPPPASTTNTSSSFTTAITCPGQADLSITKNGPSSVIRGDNPTYIVSVTNAGPATATNVVVTDPIPAGTTFVAGSSDPSCAQQGGSVVCGIGGIPAGQTKNVTIVFNVPVIQNCSNTTMQNTASVALSETDPTPGNNTSGPVTTSVACGAGGSADLSITKTGPATGVVGQPITYTIVVQNAGPAMAQGVTVSDLIPPGATYQTANQPCAVQAPNVVCSLGAINTGDSKTLTITFIPTNPSQCNNTFSIFNVAVVDSQTSDSNPGNNTSQTVTSVIACSPTASSNSSAASSSGMNSSGASTSGMPASSSSSAGMSASVASTSAPASSTASSASRASAAVSTSASSGNSASAVGTSSSSTSSSGTPQCRDGNDNDGDGAVDMNDVGCSNPDDTDEGNPKSQCQDGQDNDGDGAVDMQDFSCSNGNDNDETNPKAQCQDGYDNDGDGSIDLNDPGCSSRQDNDEYGGGNTSSSYQYQCQDGRDNDGDGRTDYPSDAGCSDRYDDSEGSDGNNNGNRYDCNDGRDNDGDGLVDYPADTGCSDRSDFSEDGGFKPTGAVSVQKNADRFEAQPGDIVSYTVTVRNDSGNAVDGASLEDTIDGSAQAVIVDGGGAQVLGNTLRWTVGRLERGESRTFTYRVRLGMGLRHGDSVTNRVRISGGFGSTEGSSTIRIIERLPQTGFFDGKTPHLTRIKNVGGSEHASSAISWLIGMMSLVGAGFGMVLRRLRV